MQDKIVNPGPPARKQPLIYRSIQWVMVIFCAFLLIGVVISQIDKINLSGAPIVLFCLTIALLGVICLAHSPPIFFRIRPKMQPLAYFGLIGWVVLFGNYLGQMDAVYVQTPRGAKEAKENAARDAEAQQLANEQKKLIDAAEVENRSKRDEEAKLGPCKNLVSQIQELSKQKNGPEIIEINDITRFGDISLEPACHASAITSRGQSSITFGIEKTPQGNELLTLRFR